MRKQAAKTRVFTQETLTELQDKMHKYAEQEMNEHPEIFEGENLKEIEKGRNSDWSKEFFIRKKEEALDALNEQYAEAANAVEVKETVLEELNKQTEETDHIEKEQRTGTGITFSLNDSNGGVARSRYYVG